MAKGQQKSNKEIKRPKKEKPAAAAPASFEKKLTESTITPKKKGKLGPPDAQVPRWCARRQSPPLPLFGFSTGAGSGRWFDSSGSVKGGL